MKAPKLLDMDLTCNKEASENSPLFIVNVERHPCHSESQQELTQLRGTTYVTLSGKTNPLDKHLHYVSLKFIM